MGLRFRKSIKIAPGVRWNLGLKSSSISFGPRGAKLTIGSRGTRATVGLPGTGLSFTSTVPSSRRSTRQTAFAGPDVPWDDSLYERMSIDRSRDSRRWWTGTISVVAFFCGLAACGTQQVEAGGLISFAALVGLITAGAMPTAAQIAVNERNRRIRELLATEVDVSSAESISELVTKRDVLFLLPAEAPQVDAAVTEHEHLLEVQRLQAENERTREAAHAELATYSERVKGSGGRLETVDGHESVVGDEPCYFVGSAVYDKRGPNDESGTLYVTERGFLFVGDSRTDVPWSKVVSVEQEDDTTLHIQRRDRETPTTFVLDSLSEALRAEFITTTCLQYSRKT